VKTILKTRVSQAHYADNLASGAYVLELFGDAATELLIRQNGTEGLFRAYEVIDFLAPVRSGDFLEIEAEMLHIGTTSRKIRFEARKIIAAAPTAKDPHAAILLPQPVVVATAVGTCVVKP